MSRPDLSALPGLTLHGGEPVFNEPWEAQAFALAVTLHEHGAFSWSEWAQALSQELEAEPDRAYYRSWLAALEKLSSAKGLTAAPEIDSREREWHDAAARTPHGEPIVL